MIYIGNKHATPLGSGNGIAGLKISRIHPQKKAPLSEAFYNIVKKN